MNILKLFFGPRDLGRTKASGLVFTAFALMLFAVPAVVSDYEAMNFAFFLVNIPLGLSVALIWGYCGVLSFGQVAFFGLAGYFYGMVAGNMTGIPGSEIIGIFAAIGLSVSVAAILAYFLFFARVENWIIPVITLVFTLLLETFLSQTAGYQWRVGTVLLGGYNGMTGIPSMRFFSGDPLYGYSFYYYALGFVVLLFTGLRLFVNSKYGLVVVAMRENLQRTELLGYDVRVWQFGVFLLAAVLASFSGVLYVQWGNYITPNPTRARVCRTTGYLGGNRWTFQSVCGVHCHDFDDLVYFRSFHTRQSTVALCLSAPLR